MKADFDTAIGPVPPSSLDVDHLISRGRRRHLVRRLTVAGTATGAAAVAVGVAVALSTGGGPAAGVAEQPSVAVSSPADTASPNPDRKGPKPTSTGPSPSFEPADVPATPPAKARATEIRLTQAIKDVVNAKAPGYTFSATDRGPAFKVQYLHTDRAEQQSGIDTYFGMANLTGPSGFGNLSVNVGRKSALWDPSHPCGPGEPADVCTETTEPNGAKVLRRVIRENDIVDYYVIVDRPDGMVTFVVAANQGGQGDAGPGHQALPVLTMDQVVAIAQDPRLTT